MNIQHFSVGAVILPALHETTAEPPEAKEPLAQRTVQLLPDCNEVPGAPQVP
jgi:hypothetical protein